MKPVSVFLLVLSAFSAAGGQLLLKVGAAHRDRLIEFINPSIVGGLTLYMLSTAIWIYALSSEKLVNVYAFTRRSIETARPLRSRRAACASSCPATTSRKSCTKPRGNCPPCCAG